jgi:hypothetical protein
VSDKKLGTTLMAALAVETIGQLGGKQLPAPRQYLATWLLWFVLGLVAGLGERAERFAWQLSALVVLTMMIVGPFGNRLLGFLNGVGRLFPTEQQGGTA